MKALVRTAAASGLLAAGLLTALAGCAALEPYDRGGAWSPTGANEADLAAMAANPAELARGRAGGPADGQLAAMAVERLRLGHVKPLAGANDSAGAVGGTALRGN